MIIVPSNVALKAAPAFDSSAGPPGQGGASVSWSHTVSGAGSAVLVYLLEPGLNSTATTISCGGVSMTKLSRFTDYLQYSVFGLLNVSSGSKTIAVNSISASAYGVSVAYSGVSAFGTPVGASGSGSISITGSSSSLISAGVLAPNVGSVSISPNQRIGIGYFFYAAAAGDRPGTGSPVSFTNDQGGSMIAIELT